MPNKCKYCGKIENIQYSPCLECRVCHLHIHLECLIGPEPPGNFPGDVLFIFTCADCSEGGEEIFERGKMSWLNCLIIVLYDLTTKCNAISNQGFFHWRTHIGSFINRNWHFLFHPQVKRRKNWAGTFSGILSQYSPIFFQSGTSVLNESGWWKLSHEFSPTLIKHLYSELTLIKQRERANKRSNNSFTNEKDLERDILKQLVSKMGFDKLLSSDFNGPVEVVQKEDLYNVPYKKPKIEPAESYSSVVKQRSSSLHVIKDEPKSSSADDQLSNYFLDGEESLSDFDSFLPDFEEMSECSSGIHLQNEIMNNGITEDYYSNYPSSSENMDSDFISPSPQSRHIVKFTTLSEESDEFTKDTHVSNSTLKPKHVDIPPPPIVRGLFTANCDKEIGLPWDNKSCITFESLMPATEYEEIQILNHLNNVCRKAKYENINKEIIRLRAKLSLRKLKRSKHISAWNFDRLVCQLANFPIPDNSQFTQHDFRVLDRFQHATDSLSGSTLPLQVDFATRLAGRSEVSSFQSPYSGRMLKPFIRRDVETTPLWLKLMNELRQKVNEGKLNSIPYETAPLDYCYVRPQHIASINNLCAQYFWPGIDVTETLQYPDFSCVVLYKKLVVAFAFLVPDVGPNETYISFIFTRPEWRNSGIANFMLYHLIQTCIDKDITIHVSATNPAVFLYQKFGFKIEELIQEFYEKYFPAESSECKHALFLRLCR